MKELSIEQKAKRYDEAIEIAKTFYDKRQPISGGNVIIENIFPELVKLEDERIRKALLEIVHDTTGDELWVDYNVHKEEALAWLERQGEQESVVVIPKFRVGDVIRPKGSMAEYTIESISEGCYHGKGWGLNISSDNDYELVEQKSSWSKEDENMLQSVLWHVSNSVSNGKSQDFRCDLTEWLKSLKDRVQPKQEWSDERTLTTPVRRKK